MSQNRFDLLLGRVLVHEGGFVDHPKDPGGATNFGVTQNVYDAHRRNNKLAVRPVFAIKFDEVKAIYKLMYWDVIRGEQLPKGVDYAVLDLAINSGVNRAIRYLQLACGLKDDGIIGPRTLEQANKLDPELLVAKIMQRRKSFLTQLRTFPTFGKGWLARVESVKATALKEAKG
jgi:lysozyme family protein